MAENVEPGWYLDPSKRHEQRWYDGSAWTTAVMDGGVQGVDDPRQVADEPQTAVAPPAIPLSPVALEKAAAEQVEGQSTAGYDKSAGWVVVGGLVAMALGSLLPWAEVSAGIFSVNKNGTDGDGIFTLVIAAVVALFVGPLVKRALPTARLGFGLAFSAIAAAICIYDIADVQRLAGDAERDGVQVSVGIGLWLTAAGAIAAVGACIVAISRQRKRVTTSSVTWPTG